MLSSQKRAGQRKSNTSDNRYDPREDDPMAKRTIWDALTPEKRKEIIEFKQSLEGKEV